MRRLLPAAGLLAALALAFGFGLQDHLSIEALRAHRSLLTDFVASHAVAAALIFMATYALSTALSLPGGLALTLAGGFLFGIVPGTVYVVIAATLGATVVFLVARGALGGLFRAKAGPFVQRMEAGFRENAFSYLLVLRLIPLFPFVVVNLVPAFLGVPLVTYVAGTFIGIIPGTLVFILAGAGLGSIFDRGGAFTVDSVLTPEIVAGLIGLSLLSLLPVVYKRVKARKSAT
jgi:uncharacterized membrane protein YdjX (TVP38/TMEM64 family)